MKWLFCSSVLFFQVGCGSTSPDLSHTKETPIDIVANMTGTYYLGFSAPSEVDGILKFFPDGKIGVGKPQDLSHMSPLKAKEDSSDVNEKRIKFQIEDTFAPGRYIDFATHKLSNNYWVTCLIDQGGFTSERILPKVLDRAEGRGPSVFVLTYVYSQGLKKWFKLEELDCQKD